MFNLSLENHDPNEGHESSETNESHEKDADDIFVDALKGNSDVDDKFLASMKEHDASDDDFVAALKSEEAFDERDVIANKTEHPEPEYNIPRTGGKWEGEPGDSLWKPDLDKKPENPKTNPDDQTWGEILDEFGIEGIPFEDGEPDFSELSKGTVEIDDFSEDRADNFDAADEALAEQKGCTKEEVRQWRKEHGYTWHECADMKTMQKVPTKVHGNVPHSGGISEKKKENGNG